MGKNNFTLFLSPLLASRDVSFLTLFYRYPWLCDFFSSNCECLCMWKPVSSSRAQLHESPWDSFLWNIYPWFFLSLFCFIHNIQTSEDMWGMQFRDCVTIVFLSICRVKEGKCKLWVKKLTLKFYLNSQQLIIQTVEPCICSHYFHDCGFLIDSDEKQGDENSTRKHNQYTLIVWKMHCTKEFTFPDKRTKISVFAAIEFKEIELSFSL